MAYTGSEVITMATTNELKAYIEVLKKTAQTDDAAFNSAVARGMDVLQLLDSDLALHLGVSRPTVNRWRTGANAPHPAMRKHIFDWLKNRAVQLSRAKEAVLAGS
jgi:transcriptional regulator with XRE-family HTH domain